MLYIESDYDIYVLVQEHSYNLKLPFVKKLSIKLTIVKCGYFQELTAKILM